MKEETNTPNSTTKTPKSTVKTTRPRSQSSKRKRPHSPLDPIARAKAKAAFLLSMSRRNNITEACEAAHIDYKTYYYWLEHGYLTVEELQEAKQKFDDKCRGLVLNMAINGEEECLTNVHQGSRAHCPGAGIAW